MFNTHSIVYVLAFCGVLVTPALGVARGPDFDDDNFEDLAIGAPGETIGAINSAGLVNVLYGSVAGLTDPVTRLTSLWQDAPSVDGASQADDRFGLSMAWGNFNGDCFDDLVVGVYGQDVGAVDQAGAVHVFYGSSTGLSTTNDHVIDRSTMDMDRDPEVGGGFGRSLAAGDFNDDGVDDIAIGVNHDSIANGSVHIVYGGTSLSPLNGPGDQVIDRDHPIRIMGEGSDSVLFGNTLASGDFNCDGIDDLAVGDHLATVGGVPEAGAVNIIYGSATGLNSLGNDLVTQAVVGDGSWFGHSLAVANFNNDNAPVGVAFDCEDLAVGIPAFSNGSEGSVAVFYGTSASGIQLTSPASVELDQGPLEGAPEAGDLFGWSMVAAKADNDGFDDLFVGIWGENGGEGAVAVIRGSSGGLTATGNQLWNQSSPNIPNAPEADDLFGYTLGYGHFKGGGDPGAVVFGVPHESPGSIGEVHAVYMSNTSTPTAASSQQWSQASIDVQVNEADDFFGDSMPAPRNKVPSCL